MQLSDFFSIIAIVVSVVCIFLANRNDFKVVKYEKRSEIYSELAYYLVQIYNNHNLIEEYYDEIVGISAKAYFYASTSVNKLIDEFLELMDKEYEKIEMYKKSGLDRDTDYNEFDIANDVLVETMKEEIDKLKNSSSRSIRRLKKLYTSYIGKTFTE